MYDKLTNWDGNAKKEWLKLGGANLKHGKEKYRWKSENNFAVRKLQYQHTEQ
jgi:hypothetical protein